MDRFRCQWDRVDGIWLRSVRWVSSQVKIHLKTHCLASYFFYNQSSWNFYSTKRCGRGRIFPRNRRCGSDAYGFADVDPRFGDGFAGLAVEALGQRGRSVAALPGLQGQLIGHLEGLAQGQDDLVRQVLTSGEEAVRIQCEEEERVALKHTASALTTSKAVKTWQ